MAATAEPGGAGPGRLLALEGIDGCGKSTQARLLGEATGAEVTGEPGGTAVGTALRRVLLDPGLPPLSSRTEALLMAADRAEHVEQVIRPALAAGRWVVTDRFSGSTLAYQGYGRGLEVSALDRLVRWATDGVEADLVLLVDVPVDVARARRARRALGAPPDRIERQGRAFQQDVRRGFLDLAAADPGRWVVVDGSGRPAEVAAAVRRAVDDRLGPPPGGWR